MNAAAQRRFTVIRAYHNEFVRSDPFRRFGAHAVGIGWKVTDGTTTKKPALRIYVAQKRPLATLAPDEIVPETIRWTPPGQDTTVTIPTDVIESAPGRPLMVDPESRLRPVPGGVSGSAMGSGTLGAWVWDTLDDSIVMLSNAHVLGYAAGVPILQPATTDGGQVATDRIGEVKRAVAVDPVEGPSPWPMEQCNFVDAAIGAADSSDLMDLTVVEVGPGIYATAVAALDMEVEMSGQTTGHTTGVVVDVDYAAAYETPLGPGNWQTVAYCDLIVIEPSDPGTSVALPGDSGSVAFTPDAASVINPAVGLIAWGNGGANAIAAKIQHVFDELHVDVLCSGGFAAFLDALAVGEDDAGAAIAVATFEPRRPRPARTLRRSDGLARDVQRRLDTSTTGRAIDDVIRAHRAELLSLTVRDGDVRRALVHTLRPMLRGAVTSDHVFEHRFSAQDVERVGASLEAVLRRGSDALTTDVDKLRRRLRPDSWTGMSVAEVIETA